MISFLKRIYQTHNDTIRDYFWRALQLFGKEGITFFIFVIAAKFLAPLEFGKYNYLMAVILFLIMFGDFGISTATSKFIAQYQEIDQEKMKSVLFNSSIVIACLSVVMIVATLLFGSRVIHDGYEFVPYLLPLVFLAPMTSLYDGIYRGLRRFKQLTTISLVVGIPFLLVITLLIKYFGLIGALISQDLFYLILLLGLASQYREWKLKISKSVMLEVVKYSAIIGLTTLSYFFFTRINVLILGGYGYLVQVGSYEIINKTFSLLLIPFSILAQVLAPQIARLAAKGEKQELLSRYKKNLTFAGVVAAIVAVSFYLLFPLVVRFFLKGYDVGEITHMLRFLLIILVTQAVSAVASVGFSTASGHAKLNMYFLAIFGVLNVILTSLFIRLFGFWGVIYSTVIVKSLSDISFVYTYYRYIRYAK